ncbi:MAG: hypothetical protein RIQ79_2450 [Verrucomicrobiota bacterium]
MSELTAPLNSVKAEPGNGLDGRWFGAALIAVYVIILVIASGSLGKTRVLSAAGAIQMSEHFADLTLFSAARHELDLGGDPYLTTAYDPWGRPYNYPMLWLTFMRFPVNWIPAVGGALIIAWLTGIGWWWGRLTVKQGLLAGLAVCSPPLVLAMERGNCDLIIFLLILLALAMLQQGWSLASWLVIFFTFMLKLYPVAGFVVLLRLSWRRSGLCLAATLLTVTGYIGWKKSEILTVLHHTPTDIMMTYGATHWAKVAGRLATEFTGKRYPFQYLEAQSMLWAALVFILSMWLGWSRRKMEKRFVADRYLDGFRIGACIYALTFIVGSNYVYRQMFLLLCLPWLWRKTADSHASKLIYQITLALIFAVLWINPFWWFPLSVLSELSSWSLLGTLGWLLGAGLELQTINRDSTTSAEPKTA